MSRGARKQARWRALNEKVLSWYEEETGISRSEIRSLIKQIERINFKLGYITIEPEAQTLTSIRKELENEKE